MKVLIIEDEKLAQDKLASYLKSVDNDIQIVNFLETVVDSIEWLQGGLQVDLIFSDIQLSDGTSFEIFENIRIPCPIIFVTAYDQYAVQALRLNSLDYILKPIQKEDLMNAVMKFYKHLYAKNIFNGNRLSHNIRNADEYLNLNYKSRFMTKMGETFTFTPVEDIAYFFLDTAGTYLYTWDQKKQFIDYNLDTLEELLEPSQFFRINRSFIAHINAIGKLIKYSNRRLKVEVLNYSRDDLIISRDKAVKFKQWLDS